jgi:myo-inositol-1(or 4)-monophosphatase
MLTIAVRAARNAGDIIRRSSDNISQLTINQKTKNDFTSEIDWKAEQEIIKVIRASYPDHGFLAEESGEQAGNDYVWVINQLLTRFSTIRCFNRFKKQRKN